MIGSEINIRLDPQSMHVLRELTAAMNREVDRGRLVPPLTPGEVSLILGHVHCGHCEREATECHRNVAKGGEFVTETVYRCQGCGCIGSRDDRGSCGTIRWG